MDAFTAFSTSPGVVAAAMQGGSRNAELELAAAGVPCALTTGSNSSSNGGPGAELNSGAAFSTLVYDGRGPYSLSRHPHTTGVTGLGGGDSSLGNTPGAVVGMAPTKPGTDRGNPLFFSTATHVGVPTAPTTTTTTTTAAALGGWSRYGTLHLTGTIDYSGVEFEKSLDHLQQTLQRLHAIAEGRATTLCWADLIQLDAPVESAQKINATLTRVAAGDAAWLDDAHAGLAACLTTPAHLVLLTQLDEPHRAPVRNHVLGELLSQLMSLAGPLGAQFDACVAMLTAMARHGLILLSGVVAMIGQFLAEPERRRAGVRVLGRVAEAFADHRDTLVRALDEDPKVRALLRELYEDPLYEPDVVSITHLLDESDAASATCVLAELAHSTPVCGMHYLPMCDLLLSAQCGGTVLEWGGGASTTASQLTTPRTLFELTPGRLPIAIAGGGNGATPVVVVVADMPVLAESACARYVRGGPSPPTRRAGARSAADALPGSLESQHARLHLLRPGTPGDAPWHVAEVVERPRGTVMTAVTVLDGLPSSSLCCVAESGLSGIEEKEQEGNLARMTGVRQHGLVLLDVTASSQVVRRVTGAHADYITALTGGDAAEPGAAALLLSGARDATVRMWDVRAAPVVATLGGSEGKLGPVEAVVHARSCEVAHADTISALLARRDRVWSASLDGALRVWDLRHTASPLLERTFAAPVFDVASLEGGRLAVATARGLYVISAETLRASAVVPNRVYTRLCVNDAADMLFAASEEGVTVYGVGPMKHSLVLAGEERQ